MHYLFLLIILFNSVHARITLSGSPSATPGNNQEVIFNNSGAFGTDSLFVFDAAANLLTIPFARLSSGILSLSETTTPSPLINNGKIYTKTDNLLYFQTGAGDEKIIQAAGVVVPHFESFTLISNGAGTEYFGGFYEAPVTDAKLTQIALTQIHGVATQAIGAHAFLVAATLGTCSGGTTGACTIVVSGNSITDAGVRTVADSETLVTDITTLITNQYVETTKKWLGQITYTIGTTGDRTTFALDFNFGFAKYDDAGNNNFTITEMDCAGRAGGNDTVFNISLLLHSSSGWIYNATAFVPGGTVIVDMVTDYITDVDLINGGPFAYKRSGLSQIVNGKTSGEGYLGRVITSGVKTIDFLNCHVGVTFIL